MFYSSWYSCKVNIGFAIIAQKTVYDSLVTREIRCSHFALLEVLIPVYYYVHLMAFFPGQPV